MSRHHDSTDVLDPAVVAELAALDAALAGDSHDSEWAALVAAVRDEVPAASPGFARTLDERVTAGFPRTRPAWLRLPQLRGPALAVLACAVVLCGVVGLAASGLDLEGGTDEMAMSTTSAESASAEVAASDAQPGDGPTAAERTMSSGAAAPAAQAQDLEADGAPSGVAAAPGPAGAAARAPALSRADRKIERSTQLRLTTDSASLQDAADGIVRTTQDLGGFVSSSTVDSSPSSGEAAFALRIPTARLDDALKRFGELADVAQLSQGTQDITASFVSARSRLTDARAERKALLAAFARAEAPRAITSVRARLRGNRTEIARLETSVRRVQRRADLARVNVDLSATGTATDPDAGGAWGPRDAADDALRLLEVIASVLLVAAAVLLPLALLATAAALAGRGLRRRRRDAALGAG